MTNKPAILVVCAIVIAGGTLAVWMLAADSRTDSSDGIEETADRSPGGSQSPWPGNSGCSRPMDIGAAASRPATPAGDDPDGAMASPHGVLRGKVTDSEGLVVAGLDLVVYSVAETWSPRFTRSDSSGEFRFEGLPPGEVEIGWRSLLFLNTPRVRTATHATGVRIQVVRGGLLHGRVIDTLSRKPIKEFQISIALEPPQPTWGNPPVVPPEWQGPREFNSDSGEFRSDQAFLDPARTYRVTITAAGYHPCAVSAYKPSADPTTSALEFDLHAARMLAGQVIWFDTDEPVAGATVSVTARPKTTSSRAEALTDAQGRFLISTPTDVASWIEITHLEAYPGLLIGDQIIPRWPAGGADITSASGLSSLGTLTLVPAAEASATVTNEKGSPVKSASLRVSIAPLGIPAGSEPFSREARTNSEGVAYFGTIPPGLLTLSIVQDSASGNVRTMTAIRVAPRHHPNMQVTLKERECRLRGAVTTSRLVTETIVLVLSRKREDGRYAQVASQKIQAPGQYSFQNLTPGLFRVEGLVTVQGRIFRGSREFNLTVGNPPINLNIRVDE